MFLKLLLVHQSFFLHLVNLLFFECPSRRTFPYLHHAIKVSDFDCHLCPLDSLAGSSALQALNFLYAIQSGFMIGGVV